ncbi:MAG: DNA-binding protein [Methylotenera sp.]|uniref:DNA-binding protein n=1 Tax=Methylotenera sp. TaxID=2051956 RepID=UPI00179935EA|nr:DNA-binding protein [Methylotenera sp.]NOU25506.1 DNA-binding protein [Methylotenera sp.]
MTPQQIKDDFAAKGIPVSDWAKKNGFNPSDVYRVLNGLSRGAYGTPHRIKVALGLKPNPNQ